MRQPRVRDREAAADDPGRIRSTPALLPPYACRAVYNASWYADMGWVDPDGQSLVVILPTPERHPWCIDARASNCTMKDDDAHRCWVRHGRPEDGTLHVENGHTCAAGAGSIAVPGYHGFLHNGALVDC